MFNLEFCPQSYQAKLSDFGLAKMGPADSRSHVTVTHVMGTPGYAAPEYVATGKYTQLYLVLALEEIQKHIPTKIVVIF